MNNLKNKKIIIRCHLEGRSLRQDLINKCRVSAIMQTLKSSEDCGKFSKSVSYETLVGGTTTIGTGIKQTQNLSECCADKPLTAIGSLTSLLCNSAKVVEKLFQISPTLRLKKVLSLLAVLSVGMISESWAGIIANGDDCAADDGSSTCHWEIDSSGKLSITGSGAIKDFFDWNLYENQVPWKQYSEDIKSLDVQGISKIAGYNFTLPNLEEANIGNSVKIIGHGAFEGSTNLKTVSVGDALEKIDLYAFYHTGLSYIQIPDTIKEVRINSLSPYDMNKLKIVCRGDISKCQNALKNYEAEDSWESGAYPFDLMKNIVSANYKECTSANYFWDGASCIREPDLTKRKCCNSCKDMGGWCNRVRYTPAEAAQVLKDDGNIITITFKK